MIQTFSLSVLLTMGLGAVESTAALEEECTEVKNLGLAPCFKCEKVSNSDSIVRLTAKEMRDQVDHLKPLKPPGLGMTGLNLRGIVRAQIVFSSTGKVLCVRLKCGHPLAFTSAIKAIPQWTFNPVVENGVKKGGCGIVTIRYRLRYPGSCLTELQ